MTPEERKKFLAEHRLCIVAYERQSGPPALTPVYYAMDGDDLLISTTRSRAKAKAIVRDPRVSICVLGEAIPFPYLTVYGRGRIEDTQVVETMMKVGERMTGNPIMVIVMNGVLDVLAHFIGKIGQQDNPYVLPSRRRFMKHFRARDADKSVAEMTMHLKRLQRTYLSRVDGTPAA